MDLGKMLSQLEKVAADTTLPAPPPIPDTHPSIETLLDEYLKRETESLNSRQNGLQETVQVKTRELQTAKETLLVISGAIQGMQHVAAFLQQQKNARLEKEQLLRASMVRNAVPTSSLSPLTTSGAEEVRSVARGYVPIHGSKGVPLTSREAVVEEEGEEEEEDEEEEDDHQ